MLFETLEIFEVATSRNEVQFQFCTTFSPANLDHCQGYSRNSGHSLTNPFPLSTGNIVIFSPFGFLCNWGQRQNMVQKSYLFNLLLFGLFSDLLLGLMHEWKHEYYYFFLGNTGIISILCSIDEISLRDLWWLPSLESFHWRHPGEFCPILYTISTESVKIEALNGPAFTTKSNQKVTNCHSCVTKKIGLDFKITLIRFLHIWSIFNWFYKIGIIFWPHFFIFLGGFCQILCKINPLNLQILSDFPTLFLYYKASFVHIIFQIFCNISVIFLVIH